jgi:hypothetical protein
MMGNAKYLAVFASKEVLVLGCYFAGEAGTESASEVDSRTEIESEAEADLKAGFALEAETALGVVLEMEVEPTELEVVVPAAVVVGVEVEHLGYVLVVEHQLVVNNFLGLQMLAE